jgi:hypothetical protein
MSLPQSDEAREGVVVHKQLAPAGSENDFALFPRDKARDPMEIEVPSM